MKSKSPLRLSIPRPCAQNFDDMSVAGAGRFCGECKNIVYDFSQMTDAGLFRFFQNSPAGACGRFHNDQLNRDITPVVIKRNIYQRTAKIAASIIAILTLRNTGVHAQKTPAAPVAQNPVAGNRSLQTTIDPLIIKGTIKNDDDYKPLANVLINFDGIKETRTDQNGNYALELTGIDKPHNIYFSCPNYVATVRTFNPAMGSSNFDILMGERDSNAVAFPRGGGTGGIVAFNQTDNFPSLTFKGLSTVLTNDNMDMLDFVADKLKGNPTESITITGYRRTHENIKIAISRADKAKKYLVNRKGISSDRISTNTEESSTGGSVVDIKAD